MLDPPFGLFSFVLVRKHGCRRLFKVRNGIVICASVYFLLTDHESEQVLFSSGTDLVKTGLKVLVWSEVWLGPILQTNWAGSLAGVFSKKSDGLLCLGVPCLNVRDLVTQIVETRFRLGTFVYMWNVTAQGKTLNLAAFPNKLFLVKASLLTKKKKQAITPK